MVEADQVLDCSGLNCPLPVLKTKKAVDAMQPGQILKMISTDPGSQNDITAWCKRTNNELLESATEGGKFIFTIKKS
ncbi:MAG: sulfurtransferase TusA family protein [Nitrospirae bacterium]|nr:MAG: sulfurtransferase TusA family protein [Nitrospirota bacterium]